MAGRDTERIRKTNLINAWLGGWCHLRNLCFFQPQGNLLHTWFDDYGWGPPRSLGEKNSGPGAVKANCQGFKLALKGEGDHGEPAHDQLQDSISKLERQNISGDPQPAASYDDDSNKETKSSLDQLFWLSPIIAP